MTSSSGTLKNLEALVRRDPGGRGVASYRGQDGWLAAGQFDRAARELAAHARGVAIVTGFCIAAADPPAAETDGPPGALYLARALTALGIEVVLISDRYGLPLLECGCRWWGLDAERLEIPSSNPFTPGTVDDATDWSNRFLDSPLGKRLTHLVSIERVGPSHTAESLAAQTRTTPPPWQQFAREVPPEHRDVCHNMRGESIEAYTAPAHRLFEAAAARRGAIKTIGIGDGGNEIGMGALPWESLRAALPGQQAGRIICRIATDYLILAGISNWGAYGLACAVTALRGRGDLLSGWDGQGQARLIEHLVRESGAVDGVTKKREPTVDGVRMEDYSIAVGEMTRVARQF